MKFVQAQVQESCSRSFPGSSYLLILLSPAKLAYLLFPSRYLGYAALVFLLVVSCLQECLL